MAAVTFDQATRLFPGQDRPAVDALDLHVEDGELLVLVGPPVRQVHLPADARRPGGRGRRAHPHRRRRREPASAKDRDVAMVFQNYALYPHMSVAENMGFALKVAGAKASEIRPRVEEAARMLDIEQFLDRKPKALSGGQRQRVAMGRAIVRQPKVFLMDEPLSNLDAKLRCRPARRSPSCSAGSARRPCTSPTTRSRP